jgi:hypothetical protein
MEFSLARINLWESSGGWEGYRASNVATSAQQDVMPLIGRGQVAMLLFADEEVGSWR